jgi:hypothetical protein
MSIRVTTTGRWPASAMAIIREVGDRQSETECLRYLGGIHGRHGRYDTTMRALGDDAAARAHRREALAIFERLRTAAADEVRALLAERA